MKRLNSLKETIAKIFYSKTFIELRDRKLATQAEFFISLFYFSVHVKKEIKKGGEAGDF